MHVAAVEGADEPRVGMDAASLLAGDADQVGGEMRGQASMFAAFDAPTAGRTVHRVNRYECERLVIDIHYAHRWPSVSYAFGLYVDGCLEGCVTFGTPSSAKLRSGVCGPDMARHVLELNRLCLVGNRRNDASFLVAAALRALPDSVVVSYADKAHSHVGYVYQACNFLYCGLSEKRTDWHIDGRDGIHGQTIADEMRGVENRAAAMREKYGDAFSLVQRSRKHRYVTFTGNKRFRKVARRALRYAVSTYPKSNAP